MSKPGAGRYLAFELGTELFAIEVERVEVVLESAAITRVPKAPPHLRGVINYRGAVIPVADLRVKFGQNVKAQSLNSSIVVLRVNYGAELVTIGMLADMVHEVIELEEGDIETPPQVGAKLEDSIVAGIGHHDGRFIVILDIDEALKMERARPVSGLAE